MYEKLKQKEYQHQRYLKYREFLLERSNERKNEQNKKLRDYKASKGCAICGEKDPCCLDFHHLDPSEKDFGVCNGKGLSWERILREIEKCVVLCSNCHKKLHAGRASLVQQ